MGYTIAAHAKNVKLQIAMIAFMKVQYRKSDEIFPGIGNYSRLAVGWFGDDALSYDKHKLAIGFDHSSAEPERDYIFAVTRWMALKIGSQIKVKGLTEKVPCIYYDGGHNEDERWPVLPRTKWKKKVPEKWNWCLTNDVGHRPTGLKFLGTPLYEAADAAGKKKLHIEHSRCMKDLCGYNFEEMDKLILKELKRLEAASVKFLLIAGH
jgi:hypothetical protein